MKPYSEEHIEKNVVIRKFLPTIDDSELEWHWDEQYRVVVPLNDNDWMFQFDNRLPFPIKEKINIPAGVIHRVIKGTTELIVKIENHDEQ